VTQGSYAPYLGCQNTSTPLVDWNANKKVFGGKLTFPGAQ